MTQLKMAEYFLDSLKELKLFHWFTDNYDVHIISGNLYDQLSLEIDAIVEGVLSSDYMPPNAPKVARKNPLQVILSLETYLLRLKSARVQSNVDNAEQLIGKFLYLFSKAQLK